MRRALFASVLSLLTSSSLAANEDGQRATTIGVTYGQDRLSNNLPGWNERALPLQLGRNPAPCARIWRNSGERQLLLRRTKISMRC